MLPLLATLARLFRSRALLHLEILALRQQLATLAARDCGRPRIRHHERLFWIWLYRIWPGCVDTLALVKPDTLVRWHRQGFRRYWTRKSRCGRSGHRRFLPRFAPSFAGSLEKIPSGAHPASTGNCGCSVSSSPRPLSPSTWSDAAGHPLRPGGPPSTMALISSPAELPYPS